MMNVVHFVSYMFLLSRSRVWLILFYFYFNKIPMCRRCVLHLPLFYLAQMAHVNVVLSKKTQMTHQTQ